MEIQFFHASRGRHAARDFKSQIIPSILFRREMDALIVTSKVDIDIVNNTILRSLGY